MQVSGLVITTHNIELNAIILQRLRAISDITIGDIHNNNIAIVMESTDQKTSKNILKTIEEYPEVSHVDVVFVHFGQDNEENLYPVSI